MKKVFFVALFIISGNFLNAEGCESLILEYKSNNSDSLILFITEQIDKYKKDIDLGDWICWHQLRAEKICKKNTCKIELIESFLKNDYYQNPKTNKEKIALIDTYVYLGKNYRRISNYAKAKRNFIIADSLFDAFKIYDKNYNIGNKCLKHLGNIYTREGDYENAIEKFSKAEVLLKSYQAEPDNFASLYINWGNIYDDLEELNKVVTTYEKALSLKGISNVYRAKLNYKLIRARFQYYLSKKDSLAKDNFNSTPVYDYHTANKTLKRLIKIFNDRIKINRRDAYNYLNGIYSLRAEIAETFGLYSKIEIIDLYIKSLNAAQLREIENPNAREISKQYYIIGQTYLDFGEINSAKNHFYLGLQTVLPSFNPKLNSLPGKELFFSENAIFENLEGLAEVFTQQDSLDLALQAYELAFYVKLKLRSIYDFESSKLYMQQGAKEVNAKAINVAYNLYKKLNDEDVIERAFKIAERSRALVLLEAIMKNQIVNEKDSTKLKREKAIFEEPVNIARLQNNLSSNQILIEYFQTDSFLYAFKIQKDKPPAFFQLLPNFEEIDRLVEALRSEKMKVEDYGNLAFNVYSSILKPLNIETGKNIVIVPDGKLNYLPFEALVSQTFETNRFSRLSYLFQNHTLSYQYSATIFAMQQQQVNEPENTKVLSIAPVFENTKAYLKYGDDEVSEINKIIPSVTLMRDLATKENILNQIANYHILHISTHASGGNNYNQQAHIVLYNDSLKLDELYQQKINANLTVLSACETNIGKYEGGEGVMSLSRAFAYAGCPSLVSTLWNVNEKSTKEIVVEFYKNLKKGHAKDEALKQAKFNYLKSTDDANPYYWASLVIVGNTQPLNFKKPFAFANLLWLLLPLSIGAVFLLRSRKVSLYS